MLPTAVKRKALRPVLAMVIAGLVAGVLPATAVAVTYQGWFDYARNNSNTNGTLTWKYTIDYQPSVYSRSWRAGSGSALNDQKQITGVRPGGWLPTGWYSIRGHWNDYNGSAIYGRVWYLSDKVNSAGDLRTGLFVHSEETPSNGQSSTYEPQRWDGSSDYYSNGCVKVAYGGNMDDVHWYWYYKGGSTAHGSGLPYPLTYMLYVH